MYGGLAHSAGWEWYDHLADVSRFGSVLLLVVFMNTAVRIHFIYGGVPRIDKGFMYKV